MDPLETLWENLARAIDAAGPGRETLFLSKLALLMGNELGDPARVERMIEQALADLE